MNSNEETRQRVFNRWRDRGMRAVLGYARVPAAGARTRRCHSRSSPSSGSP